MKKLIKVTQHDIDKGEPCEVYSCPVARAIKRSHKKGGRFVCVGLTDIRIGKKRVPTPSEISEFIKSFDGGIDVQPFTFELEY